MQYCKMSQCNSRHTLHNILQYMSSYFRVFFFRDCLSASPTNDLFDSGIHLTAHKFDQAVSCNRISLPVVEIVENKVICTLSLTSLNLCAATEFIFEL